MNRSDQILELGVEPEVLFLHLPPARTDADARHSESVFHSLEAYFQKLHKESTVCILTTPPDAGQLLSYLQSSLKYQLWIAVKLAPETYPSCVGKLAERHAALLVLTRYKGSLRHTLTRIAYTHCPACRKTTKDYGGKKHTYNSYGTLMSDVWRDITCNPHSPVIDIHERLQDLFGLPPYKVLRVLDLRNCHDLLPKAKPLKVREGRQVLLWSVGAVPPESRLVNDDCLNALRSIPDCSIDFCFADPPYNLQKKYDRWDDALEVRQYFEWCDQWLSELGRVLKPGRTLAVINIPVWAVRHFQHLVKTFKYQNWIAWEGLSLPVRMIMPAHYCILCFSKGEPRPLPGLDGKTLDSTEGQSSLPLAELFCLRSGCSSTRISKGIPDRGEFSDLWYDIHRLKHNSRRVDHPCQLPPSLMRRLCYLFTKPDEVVLDCFDGAGTTTLVAHQMGRRFIGIELSPTYYKIALERHGMISRGEDAFGKRKSVPLSKNSRVARLPKQKYAVSKKALQLEVREIARRIGRIPSKEDIQSFSRYPLEYFEKYFVSWGEVCASARHDGMSEDLVNPGGEPTNAQLTLF